MDNISFVSELTKLRQGSSFLGLRGYRNANDEVADYVIVFHISYTNALKKSVKQLEAMTLSGEEDRARSELLASFRLSLGRTASEIEDRTDGYTRYSYEGKEVKGIKLHTETNVLHLYGLIHSKKVLAAGQYSVDTRREFTRIKDRLRSKVVVGGFRQFRLVPWQVDSILVQNIRLLPPGSITLEE